MPKGVYPRKRRVVYGKRETYVPSYLKDLKRRTAPEVPPVHAGDLIAYAIDGLERQIIEAHDRLQTLRLQLRDLKRNHTGAIVKQLADRAGLPMAQPKPAKTGHPMSATTKCAVSNAMRARWAAWRKSQGKRPNQGKRKKAPRAKPVTPAKPAE
jgi:hypothetical protein